MSAEFTRYAFISYSTQQLEYVRKLNEFLNAQGFDTWFDKERIAAGDNFIDSLARGVDQCSAVVFVWTVDSIRSKWCQREVMFADQCNKPVIRLLLEACDTDVIPPAMRFLFSVDQYEDVRGEKMPTIGSIDRLREHLTPAGHIGHNVIDQPPAPLPAASPDTLQRKIDFYLNWLSTKLKLDLIEKTTIDLSGVTKPHAGPRDTFMLAEDDLEMLKALWHGPQKQEIAREDATPVGNVLEALGSLSRVILLGEPGGGKTTTLQRLALHYVEQYRNPSPGVTPRLPVFVKLAEFNNATPFADYALKTLGDLKADRDRLSWVWLLDSFNEMPRVEVDGRKPVDEVITFLKQPPGTGTGKFVLSCRVNDYKDELRALPDLDKLELRELSPIQIKAIIDRKLKPELATALWDNLRGSDELLAAWPYFEGYEAEFWQAADDVPEAVMRRYVESASLSSEERAELLMDWQNDKLYSSQIPDPYRDHRKARKATHTDNRKLILICRNPFTLNLVCASVAEGEIAGLPRNRAGLFAGFAELLLAREAKLAKGRGQMWPPATIDRIKAALSHVAEVLQRTEQRTIIAKPDALPRWGSRTPKRCSKKLKPPTLFSLARQSASLINSSRNISPRPNSWRQ
ncbi:MAG: TIR domain-containing protein [Aggregatilineales bacterium]